MSSLKDIDYLGVGFGYRKQLRELIFQNTDQVECLEIISDQYIYNLPGKNLEVLKLTENFPVVLHGLELSLGTHCELNDSYVDKIKYLVELFKPKWLSDHLCFTGVPHNSLLTLTPLSFNKDVVDTVIKNIKLIASQLDCPFLIENISYLFAVPPTEMTEAQFLSSILEGADCYLLLDVTNLLNNAINHKYDPYDFLDRIPLERVVQVHLAGGRYYKDMIVDTHDSAIPDEVFNLFNYMLPKTPNLKGVIIERDANFEPAEDLMDELKKVKEICKNNHFFVKTPKAFMIHQH
jgi:uncharacterized protein